MTMTTTDTTITLGGQQFPVTPIPWGRLKKVVAAINRVGIAASAGIFDERTLDDMAVVLAQAFDLTVEQLDAMPTDLDELNVAFEAVVRVSGLEKQMEKALGEARRAGRMVSPAFPLTSTPGTASTST